MTIEQLAQRFLLDNDCGDLILNDAKALTPKDRIYTSDIMTKFYQFVSASQKKGLLIDFYKFIDKSNIGVFRHSKNVTAKKYFKSINK